MDQMVDEPSLRASATRAAICLRIEPKALAGAWRGQCLQNLADANNRAGGSGIGGVRGGSPSWSQQQRWSRRSPAQGGPRWGTLLLMSDLSATPRVSGNPLLDLYERSAGSAHARAEAVRRFAFAVPDEAALATIARWAPNGVIELGAGTGYWAGQLDQRGVDVVAYDTEPAPSTANSWFAGTSPWFPVRPGDQRMVNLHADRCMLLVWPTKNETWAAEAVEQFHHAGGETVVFVGEGPGGRTGDDRFHLLIGELDRCYRCAYGLLDGACVCGTSKLFTAAERVSIPTWAGFDDSLVVVRRTVAALPRRRRFPGRKHR